MTLALALKNNDWLGCIMATISTNYGFDTNAQSVKHSDEELQAIIQNIQTYLQSYNRRRFFLSVSVKYHKRCCKSWSKVGGDLQQFLCRPQSGYSTLMKNLELEIEKFPKGSYYCKQLMKLVRLLERGPSFSKKTYNT